MTPPPSPSPDLPPEPPSLGPIERVTSITSKRRLIRAGEVTLAAVKTNRHLDFGQQEAICAHCDALHWISERISSSPVSAPRYHSCCIQGSVPLTPYSDPPDLYRDLYTGKHSLSSSFFAHIRRYNAAFAFVSTTVKVDDRISNGINMYQIHGALYHLQGPLDGQNGVRPAYAQLFFYDPHEAQAFRAQANPTTDRLLLLELGLEMDRSNPHVLTYKIANARLADLRAQQRPATAFITPQLRLIIQEGTDRRRNNMPTVDEVALILPHEYDEPSKRDITLEYRDTARGLRRIDQDHALYQPLAYPMLFPRGEPGYHWGIPLQRRPTRPDPTDQGVHGPAAAELAAHGPAPPNVGDDHPEWLPVNERLSQRAFYRFHLHCRPTAFNTILRGRRLLRQYVCDAWAACKQNKLEWIAHNQAEFRADVYRGLEDALRRDDIDLHTVGSRTILPHSHAGSDRNMQRAFQDAMALVRHFGKPTVFITFTANPKWPEITNELHPGESANDRPDLMARVFRLKTLMLLDDLKRKQVFGVYLASCYSIEYQKRGLPHMHLLLWVAREDRFNTAKRIDSVISAEIPRPEEDAGGLTSAVVTTAMLHGPCGDAYPTAGCMTDCKDGIRRCSKGFPRAFSEATVANSNGYPSYRRRSSGVNFTKNGFTYDNRWVVPHNPWLSRRYGAHINVEICASVEAVKYLFKYVFKGNDRTTLQVDTPGNRDEVSTYLNARYIGPTQAHWNLMEFPQLEIKPPVMALAIHLPNQQCVRFAVVRGDAAQSRSNAEQALQSSRSSTLMAYFAYNRAHPDDANTLYQDFPNKHTWSHRHSVWTPRKSGFTLGRMYFVPATSGERFFIRLLLTVVAGSTSFEDLRTVDGTVFPSFRAAAERRGLLEDDGEWHRTFLDAALFASGTAQRRLFATALLCGEVTSPLEIWNAHCEAFCDDLKDRVQVLAVEVPQISSPHLDFGLFLLGQLLEDRSSTLDNFGLPNPVFQWQPLDRNRLIAAEQYNRESQSVEATERYNALNSDQRAIFTEIYHQMVANPLNAQFFLQGPAGTGKTTLYKAIASHLRGMGKIVLCVASSGIASILLPGGRTSHSRFKIPLDVDETTQLHWPSQSDLGQLFRAADLLIWDEVVMQHRHCLEAVDRKLRDVRMEPDHLFGGLPTLLGGDFAQILPVVPKGSHAATVHACLQQSYLWPSLKRVRLTQNMRLNRSQPENILFATWLKRTSYDPALRGLLLLPEYVQQTTDSAQFYQAVYPQQALSGEIGSVACKFFASRAVLTPHCDTVDSVNRTLLRLLPGPEHVKYAIDKADLHDSNDAANNIAPEVLASFSTGSIPLAHTRLKLGAPIMLLRNLDPGAGMCNGSRLIVTRITRHLLTRKLLGGAYHGEERLIPRISMSTTKDELPWKLTRRQFPVRLAFAMTINKAQGQSLDHVGVDLTTDVFTHGQLYVALSRATNVKNLHILLAPPQIPDQRHVAVRSHRIKVPNVVFPEVLLR